MDLLVLFLPSLIFLTLFCFAFLRLLLQKILKLAFLSLSRLYNASNVAIDIVGGLTRREWIAHRRIGVVKEDGLVQSYAHEGFTLTTVMHTVGLATKMKMADRRM
jgi:hypothetical protein